MKKLLFYVSFIVFSFGVGYFCLNSRMEKKVGVQFANIEALSEDESSGYFIPCHSSASEAYNRSYTDCSECIRIVGWKGTGTEARCKKQ